MSKNASSPSRPLTATEKMRAFLRSGRYLAPERLDDYSGDYRSSPLLGPVETADMRHHRERLREPAPDEVQAGHPCPSTPEPRPGQDSVAPGAELPAGPRLVALSADICLHRYARREICRRCIDICPTGAISPDDQFPRMDHTACLGCAACVSACPTNALSWLPSGPRALLQRVQDALKGHLEQGPAPIVVFIPQGADLPPHGSDGPPVVVVEVAPIGLVSAAVLLSAMALGAAGVQIVLDHTAGDGIRRRLDTDIRWIRRLLVAWGFAGDSISVMPLPGAIKPGATGYAVPPACYALDQSERALTRRASAHLAGHGPNPADSVALPDGAPFGTVRIDGSRCTLCMACAGACRMKALAAFDGETPRIGFTESRCVQCGACAQVCPEQAIALVPRMNPDPKRVEARLPLHQSQPARCSACGRVFASSQMIASIERKLRGHWMYNDTPAQKRLHMCDRCRIQDLFLNKGQDSVPVESVKP